MHLAKKYIKKQLYMCEPDRGMVSMAANRTGDTGPKEGPVKETTAEEELRIHCRKFTKSI